MVVKEKRFHSSSIISHSYCHLAIASRFCDRNSFSALHMAHGIAEFILTELTEKAFDGSVACQATNPAVLLGNVVFPSCKHQDKQHSKFLVAVPAETFQQHQLMVHSLFRPHNTLPSDNPSHTHLTLPNCTYLGQAHKDQEFSGPSHGHLEAAVCFRKMQSSVVPARLHSQKSWDLALLWSWWDST